MTTSVLVVLVLCVLYLALRVHQLSATVAALARIVEKPRRRDRAIRREVHELETDLEMIRDLVSAASPEDFEEADRIRQVSSNIKNTLQPILDSPAERHAARDHRMTTFKKPIIQERPKAKPPESATPPAESEIPFDDPWKAWRGIQINPVVALLTVGGVFLLFILGFAMVTPSGTSQSGSATSQASGEERAEAWCSRKAAEKATELAPRYQPSGEEMARGHVAFMRECMKNQGY
jgi:hypothetical protein